MSEDQGHNKVQISEFFSQNGQVVIRVDNVEEAVDKFEALAKNADRIVSASMELRNLAKVKGSIATEVNNTKAAVTPSGTESSGPPRAGAATCKHGLPWNDLTGQVGKNGEPYKYRLYCAFKTQNWKDRCPPEN